jgi:5'-phosphate synthase pdxT subunit
MKIGILALQGGYAEHAIVLKKLNIYTVLIKCKKDLLELNGIILPGGESTTMGLLLANDPDLLNGLKELISHSKVVVWGTCAGLILLSDLLDQENDQLRLGGLPIKVKRNGYGRQLDSFIKALEFTEVTDCNGFPGIFIRAPKIVLPTNLNSGLKVLATVDGEAVAVIKDDRIIGTSFHPELTNDTRFHKFFLDLTRAKRELL